MHVTVVPVWRNTTDNNEPYILVTRDVYGVIRGIEGNENDAHSAALRLCEEFGIGKDQKKLQKINIERGVAFYIYDCGTTLPAVNVVETPAGFNLLRIHLDVPLESYVYERTRWFWTPISSLYDWASKHDCAVGGNENILRYGRAGASKYTPEEKIYIFRKVEGGLQKIIYNLRPQ